MSNPLHPEDGIVISRKWLEGEIKCLKEKVYLSDEQKLKGHAISDIFQIIISKSQPLKPVLEVAWDNGRAIGSILSHDKSSERFKESFLNNPIEIK